MTCSNKNVFPQARGPTRTDAAGISEFRGLKRKAKRTHRIFERRTQRVKLIPSDLFVHEKAFEKFMNDGPAYAKIPRWAVGNWFGMQQRRLRIAVELFAALLM